MEFGGHEDGHCIVRAGGKESAHGIHRVFCPDTGVLAYLDTGGLRNTWVWDFESDTFYSIGILGGFGVARHNGIRIFSLGISQEGPECP
eukprot:2859606-Heterocapsa_arctica.AAC.1